MTTYRTIETGVLIVGGGGAGCRAAIEAHDQGADVLMIVKGTLGQSGCTLNVGISSAVGPWGDPADSHESSMQDLLSYGGFLGNQDLAKILVEESPDRVVEMDEWGIGFRRTDDGQMLVEQDPEHSHGRSFYFEPSFKSQHDYGSDPGIAMMDILMREMGKRNVPVLNDVMLVDLLTNNGQVVGALALDCGKNELVVIKARSVVLATGSYSQIFDPTTVSEQETGDGHAAAYRAGAELIDMECIQFVATDFGYESQSVFLNGNHEEFLPTYGIMNPRDATKEVLCYAIWSEVRGGRGNENDKIFINVKGDFRTSPATATLEESGPRSHTAIGGIRINERCETTIPGLYAAGAIGAGVYGHARPQGYTSMITLVFGRLAGLYAAQSAQEGTDTAIDEDQVQSLGRLASDLVERAGGIRPRETKTQIRAITRKHAWVIRDEDGLNEGLGQIKEITEVMRVRAEQSTFKASPRDGFEWAEYLEIPNMLACTELMFAGALERTESRGAFVRADHPDTDNGNWLKNITCKQVGGKLVLDSVPVELKYCRPESTTTRTPYLAALRS